MYQIASGVLNEIGHFLLSPIENFGAKSRVGDYFRRKKFSTGACLRAGGTRRST
jgi:hypothetical protein